jgi:hypothetical protein
MLSKAGSGGVEITVSWIFILSISPPQPRLLPFFLKLDGFSPSSLRD